MQRDPEFSFDTMILDGGPIETASGWGGSAPMPSEELCCEKCGLPLKGRKYARVAGLHGKTILFYHAACLQFDVLINSRGEDVTERINKILKEVETNDLHA